MPTEHQEIKLMNGPGTGEAISEDGVRSFGALDANHVRLWRLGALVFRPDLNLDKSLSQPFCGVETDSSLGGLGNRTCCGPEERLLERWTHTGRANWLRMMLDARTNGFCFETGQFERAAAHSNNWIHRLLTVGFALSRSQPPRQAASRCHASLIGGHQEQGRAMLIGASSITKQTNRQ
jgi:hypothetical protein